MKRTITLIVIALMLAPLASAAVVGFELDSSAVVGAGNTVQINLVADASANGYEIYGVSDGMAGGSVASLTSGITTIQAGFDDNYTKEGIGYLISSASGSASPAAAAGTVLFSFNYTISSSWDGATAIVIAPLAADSTYYYAFSGTEYSFVVADSYVNAMGDSASVIGGVTIVPEPITVALLGLGGLFIRRKK